MKQSVCGDVRRLDQVSSSGKPPWWRFHGCHGDGMLWGFVYGVSTGKKHVQCCCGDKFCLAKTFPSVTGSSFQ